MDRVIKLSTEQLLGLQEGKIYCFNGVSYEEASNMRAMAYYVSKKHGKSDFKIAHRQKSIGADKYDVELERQKL